MFPSPISTLSRCFAGICALLGLIASGSVFAHATKNQLTVGVLPNVSARLIYSSYQPLDAYLERVTGQTVEIQTAKDFKEFNVRTLGGEYDLVVTAPNLGRLAQIDGKWDVLAVYEPAIPALLVTLKSNDNSGVDQLRGKALALANPQSLVALAGLQWIKTQGLQLDADYKIAMAANEDSLGTLLTTGEAPLAMMSQGEFNAKTPGMKQLLRIASTFAQIPGLFVLANPKMNPTERLSLKNALMNFQKSNEWSSFSEVSGVKGIRELSKADTAFIDPFVETTRTSLGSTK
ncbi:MAG: hypothetical protein RL459_1464 [Pseudomonadota bacterium]